MHPIDYIKVEPSPRTAVVPTTSYVAATTLDQAWKYDQLVFWITVTKASLTSVEFKIEFSMDNTNWAQEMVESYSGGTATDIPLEHTLLMTNQTTATQSYRFAIPISDRYIRISVKGTGTLTSSSVGIEAFYGIN